MNTTIMTIISNKPMLVDYSGISDEAFFAMFVMPILKDPEDISQGVYGLCRAGAYGRLVYVLAKSGAPEPKIVKVINDPEHELTFELE